MQQESMAIVRHAPSDGGRGPVHDFLAQLLSSLKEDDQTLCEDVRLRSESIEQRISSIFEAPAQADPLSCHFSFASSSLRSCEFVRHETAKLLERSRAFAKVGVNPESFRAQGSCGHPRVLEEMRHSLQSSSSSLVNRMEQAAPSKAEPRKIPSLSELKKPKEKDKPQIPAPPPSKSTRPASATDPKPQVTNPALLVSTPLRPMSPRKAKAAFGGASNVAASAPTAAAATESPVVRGGGVRELMRKFQAGNSEPVSSGRTSEKSRPFAAKHGCMSGQAASRGSSPAVRERPCSKEAAEAPIAIANATAFAASDPPTAFAAVTSDPPTASVDTPSAAAAEDPPAPVAVTSDPSAAAADTTTTVADTPATAEASPDPSDAAIDAPTVAADIAEASSDPPAAAVDAPTVAADTPAVSLDLPAAAIDMPTAGGDAPATVVVTSDPPAVAMDMPTATKGARPKGGASRARMRSGCLMFPEAMLSASEELPVEQGSGKAPLDSSEATEEVPAKPGSEGAAQGVAKLEVSEEPPRPPQDPAQTTSKKACQGTAQLEVAEKPVQAAAQLPSEEVPKAAAEAEASQEPTQAVAQVAPEEAVPGLAQVTPVKGKAQDASPEVPSQPSEAAGLKDLDAEGASPHKTKRQTLSSLSPKRAEDNYEISEKDPNSDEEKEPDRSKKHVPSWCKTPYLDKLLEQSTWDPDVIFGSKVPGCDLQVVFPQELYESCGKKRPQRKRGSSQDWRKDRLRSVEVRNYKRKMGQTKIWND